MPRPVTFLAKAAYFHTRGLQGLWPKSFSALFAVSVLFFALFAPETVHGSARRRAEPVAIAPSGPSGGEAE